MQAGSWYSTLKKKKLEIILINIINIFNNDKLNLNAKLFFDCNDYLP